MRIFRNLLEATNEAKRDLAEMGIRVKTKTYQDKNIAGNPDYETLELQNYIYTVIGPVSGSLAQQVDLEWANAEFEERIAPFVVNPGTAWLKRKKVWQPFIHNGTFAYTYSERLSVVDQLDSTIALLLGDPGTRQAFIGIWNPGKDVPRRGGTARVPCTIGYQLQLRNGQLNLTYIQRSSDMATHFHNDVYLAVKLQEYIAEKVGVKVGTFTHLIMSLHMFRKDAKGVF